MKEVASNLEILRQLAESGDVTVTPEWLSRSAKKGSQHRSGSCGLAPISKILEEVPLRRVAKPTASSRSSIGPRHGCYSLVLERAVFLARPRDIASRDSGDTSPESGVTATGPPQKLSRLCWCRRPRSCPKDCRSSRESGRHLECTHRPRVRSHGERCRYGLSKWVLS